MKKDRLDYTKQLTDYLKKNLKKGYTKDSLKWALINQGHSRFEVERAFNKLDDDLSRKAPVLKTKPEITREVLEPKKEVTFKPAEERRPLWKKFFG